MRRANLGWSGWTRFPRLVPRWGRRRGVMLLNAVAKGLFLWLAAGVGAGFVLKPAVAQPPASRGFDLSATSVDVRQIRSGGPPKDGIPALSRPAFLTVENAEYLTDKDRVIGVAVGDDARAYPLAILNYHEIVNDVLGGTPIAATYCPLCDSAAVFDRRTPLGVREFGVSGMLFNSNVLMYDRGGKPESLWSQVRISGVSGPGADRRLAALPCELTTWKSWRMRHPNTKVLSNMTGHRRNYSRNPYAAYFGNQELMFPVSPTSTQFSDKERVLGVWVGKEFRAYAESAFPRDSSRVTEKVAGKSLTVEFDRASKTIRVIHAEDGVSWLYSFWFAWYSQHPDTTVFGR